jgi:thiamine transport system substrate-binding protein
MKMDREGGSGIRTIFSIIAVVVVISALVISAVIYLESRKEEKGENELIIYSYDSFQSWGLAGEVIPIFEEKYGYNVTLRTMGDAGNVLARLAIEKDKPVADLVIGIDNSMARKARKLDLLERYEPEGLSNVKEGLVFDPDGYLTPYDYGYIAIICNGEMMEDRELPFPLDLQDLADPVYDDSIMFPDPVTSSTGSSFLIWASSVAGGNRSELFEDLSGNSYNVFGTWDAMYTAFQAGEAPIAISYGLDTASEIMWAEDPDSVTTVTVVPDYQGYRQIEGAGIVNGAGNREAAELFLDFMLSDDFQSRVGYNVMLPVVDGTFVEQIYTEHGKYASEHVEPGQAEIEEMWDTWLADWENAFT